MDKMKARVWGVKNRLRLWFFSRLIKWCAEMAPELMVNSVMERAVSLSVRGTMAIMDREGLNHCWACTQRFGLRKLKDRAGYACAKHVPKEEKAPVPALKQAVGA